MANVLVSNGTDVVATDAAGRYTLPVVPLWGVRDQAAGYELPRGTTTCRLFYRRHWPDGPGEMLRYGGVLPTGALPAEHDFPLRPAGTQRIFGPRDGRSTGAQPTSRYIL